MAGSQSRFIDIGSKFPNGVGEFDTGMTTNPRAPGLAKIIKHFDNYSDPLKLTPHRSLKADAVTESGLDSYRIQKIINTNVGIYGFGVVSNADAHAQVYVKITPTDPTSGWTSANSGHDGSGLGGAAGFKLFIEYHNYLYGDSATGIWKYGDITGSPSFTYNDYTSGVPTAQGFVHSLDDTLYVPCSNVLARNNNGSWDTPLSFAAGSKIVDICEYGIYIALMVNQPDGRVVVYLWDRDSSLTTLSAKYDFGFGDGKHVLNLGGILAGIVVTSPNSTALNPHVYFKYVSGNDIKVFQDFNVDALPIFTGDKQQFNNILYFLASLALNGETLTGVWKIIKTQKNALIVSFDRLPRNDVAVTTQYGFQRIGDYMFVTYENPVSSLYTIWRTDDQANFLATSTYETTAFTQILGLRNKRIPDSSIVKKLVGATLTFEPLTSGQAVAVNYRIEGETSWTPIFQHSTAGDITHSAINDEVTSDNLRENKEIEFQLQSTGGAQITGFEFTQEIIGKRMY